MALCQTISEKKHCAAQTTAGRQLQLMQVCIVMLQVVNLTNKHTEVFCSLSVPMYLTMLKCREASEPFN